MLRYLVSLFTPCYFDQPLPCSIPVTEKLKLSEAMRLGSARTIESGGYYFSQGRACALGAAVVGAGWGTDSWSPFTNGGDDFLVEKFGLHYWEIVDRYTAKYRRSFEHELTQYRTTRAKIADQLEAIGL